MTRPVVGVIRGDRVPEATMLLQRPVMVRTPVIRVPLGLMVTWWCLKALAVGVVLLLRWWWITGPLVLLAGLWWWLGWPGPVAVVVVAGGLLACWRSIDRDSFDRWCWWRLLSRWRRLFLPAAVVVGHGYRQAGGALRRPRGAAGAQAGCLPARG
jgi:hypothetical protein